MNKESEVQEDSTVSMAGAMDVYNHMLIRMCDFVTVY